MVFDEIVVGSGSTGAVIATRLSEDHNRNVLLIEAGPDYPDIASTPKSILNGRLLPKEFDWGFTAEMVPGRSRSYPRGKVIGGSSSTNACLALRGMPDDYDEWARLGNPDWSWENVLPVFRQIEDDQDIQDDHHGTGGPTLLRRYKPDELFPLTSAFIDSCKELGFAETQDHNHPESKGVGTGPWNLAPDGTRQSTAIAYLLAARSRSNLTIRANSLVDQVLFDGDKAVGVTIATDAGRREAVLGARVTLSAGAIGSPAILLRSGIGPADELKAIGIESKIQNAGVGSNLTDHAYVGFSWHTAPGIIEEGIPMLQATLRFTAEGSSLENDMQINPFQYLPQPAAQLYTGLMKPYSRGKLRLTTGDPRIQPEVCLNLASALEDSRRFSEGLRQLVEFVHTAPLVNLGAHTLVLDTGESVPATDLGRRINKPEWVEEYIRETVFHYLHPVGTVRMGADDDPDAVVDQHGRVRGVSNLRVADASIMPTIPRANTHLPCVMIGERIANWMRQEKN